MTFAPSCHPIFAREFCCPTGNAGRMRTASASTLRSPRNIGLAGKLNPFANLVALWWWIGSENALTL